MKAVKIGGIIVGALIITALGIDAADTLNGNGGSLLSQIIATDTGACPAGMMPIVGMTDARCIDVYEASAAEECAVRDPVNAVQSKENLDNPSCQAVSEEGQFPWRHITREQATVACARAGKRLPTNEEWYRAALGTPDPSSGSRCNIAGNAVEKAGVSSECVSASGAYDMIGNVWEWVEGDVTGRQYDNQPLPEQGYIAQVNTTGVPVSSSTTDPGIFNADFVWSVESSDIYGVIRGGYFQSGADAGVYAFHAGTLPTTPGTAIGFRCVQ